MNEPLFIRLYTALDTAIAEQFSDGSFKILSSPTEWFRQLISNITSGESTFVFEDELSFLGGFIVDADEHWKKRDDGQILWSGPWQEVFTEGEYTELEAGAVCLDGRHILIIRTLGHNALADREALQNIREQILLFEDLRRKDQDLQKHSDFLEKEVQQRTLQVRKTLSGVIEAIMTITEMNDPYTAGHQRRVADLACAMAVEMNRPLKEIEGLGIAASMHDIGKILVPAQILSKPGKLTELEKNMIRTHCQAGYDILNNIDFPSPIARIVLQHHENIDGSGYPQGLSGDDILLKARIIRVADVMETMMSHRPYRPAIGKDEALQEIKKNRGTFYDVEAADACIKLFREKNFQFQ